MSKKQFNKVVSFEQKAQVKLWKSKKTWVSGAVVLFSALTLATVGEVSVQAAETGQDQPVAFDNKNTPNKSTEASHKAQIAAMKEEIKQQELNMENYGNVDGPAAFNNENTPNKSTEASEQAAKEAADSVITKGKVAEPVSVTEKDYYDNTSGETPITKGKVAEPVSVTEKDYYDNTSGETPITRGKVGESVSVTETDYYDNTTGETPITKGKVAEPVSVTEKDYYDNTTGETPITKGKVAEPVSVTEKDYYDNTSGETPITKGKVAEPVSVTKKDYYDNTTQRIAKPVKATTAWKSVAKPTDTKAAIKPMATTKTTNNAAAATYPKTGEAENTAIAAVGMISVIGSLAGLSLVSWKRRD